MTDKYTSKRLTRLGFTLVEVLVVIAIIAILAGILLSTLGGVQESAKKTKTESLIQSFARACDMFALDHGRYPGLLPEGAIDGVQITSIQNALLELMGGARVQNENSPNSVTDEFSSFESGATTVTLSGLQDTATGLNWDLVFDQLRFGEGPWIAGRKYEPYFSPKSSDLLYVTYATPSDFTGFPALIDAWESPIIYIRSTRTSGPILDYADTDILTPMPQFEIQDGMQFYDPVVQILHTQNSLLSTSVSSEDKLAYLTLLLAHPSFWDITSDNAGSEFSGGIAWGTPMGRYMLLSAGPDTIYLEATHDELHSTLQGGGSPLSNLISPTSGDLTPSTMNIFDDIVVHGGA